LVIIISGDRMRNGGGGGEAIPSQTQEEANIYT
jgi:hypothetical protein